MMNDNDTNVERDSKFKHGAEASITKAPLKLNKVSFLLLW